MENDSYNNLFSKDEETIKSCLNCNFGIETKKGLVCGLNKIEECVVGCYKYWKPIAEIILGEGE